MDPACRFDSLPLVERLGRTVPEAATFSSRLLGLAWLDEDCAQGGLFLPGCRAVHTFGMRFRMDVFLLAADGSLLRFAEAVRPYRCLFCGAADSVLELPAANC